MKVTWAKDVVVWRIGKTLYISVVFSWQLAEARKIAAEWKGPVVMGGPALALESGTGHCEETPYDVLSMHNPLATFTTRGCPRGCKFCAVPKIEGEFKELETWKPNPIVCDNNLLAASEKHFEKVIDSLMPYPWADFNQGLDARLFTSWHAGQIARLKSCRVRFSLDHSKTTPKVKDAIDVARAAGLKDFRVYVLIGFKDTPEDALEHLELVRSWKIWPNPMRYQPLDAVKKSNYVAPGWSKEELAKMMNYYSQLRWYEHIPYDEFVCGPDGIQMTMMDTLEP